MCLIAYERLEGVSLCVLRERDVSYMERGKCFFVCSSFLKCRED